ncbi:TSUP family transporter [Mediterraneibacter sp. NSJ-55]|uniref:Probable membrane transporter protein n=1 Tax=Mediterraneibacter hominis TaxID=2763054 RepID=A0A923LHI4_9FIRM|nr:TSUP family transporter [Mediterraneibacter hominis]MBC5688384.1 TSUP family transporter [Mediterraneibacter hominis]
MELTPVTFLIVCPLLFLAGIIDAVGGGGGLISIPAYLIAGLPPHMAVATNKLSSTCGTLLATLRFIKNRLINFKLAIPSVFAAILGSSLGARISMLVPEEMMLYILVFILPVSAFLVLNKKLFHDHGKAEVSLDRKTYLTAVLSAFFIGSYDGFYGPGTGTFLIIAFTVFAHLSIRTSNAQAKIINLTTNVTALVIFLLNGRVLLTLGIAAALCNMAGGYLGAGLVMKNGAKIVKPSILFVLFLLLFKIFGIY